MKESKIQSKIIERLNSEKIYYVKVISASKAGIPDIIVCYNGMFIGIEVKNEIGELSKLQEYNLKKIRESGGKTLVIDSYDEAKNILEVLKKVSDICI
jgi:Holliday junction resolvase